MLLILPAIGSPSGRLAAQELSPSERTALQAREEALFQQMVHDPANLDITFAYADVAARLGDNEEAVSALERILIFNPNLPRVQLELGALYVRMGTYAVARAYFEKALAANPPREVRERIEVYLAEIARLASPQQFAATLFTGVQYQSDANLAPGSPLIPLAGPINTLLPLLNLPPQFVKRPDENFFAAGTALYSYDLGTNHGDTFEVGGTGFANRHISITNLDLDVVELTAGPRFNFPDPLPQVSSASLKPYAIANDVALGENQYFHTLGVGGEATALAWDDVRLKSVFELRDKNFNNAIDRPFSRGLTGSDKLVSLLASKPIPFLPQSELNLEFDFLDQDTRLDFFANRTYAGSVAYHVRYADPTGTLRWPLDTTLFLSRSWSDYAAPELPIFAQTRFDRYWRVSLTQSFPLRTDLAVVVQLQRDIASSTVPLYAYTSNSVVIGVQFRF